MKLVKLKSILSITAPLVLVAACSGSSSLNEEPGLGQGNGTETQTTKVAGKVADGYLQGATVCVDINENGSCDSDEPQTTSGSGGSYTLDIPNGAENKPILALVPPTAIDEDTGKAIGKELRLSTPGGKPSFVSPITTLVHQELINNPSLDTDAAEATVLETLGLPNEKDASLFTDYVANSKKGEEDTREKFHYLHQTARVVATMMDEIQNNVEAAAVENGIDVTSDAVTQAAIRKLVQDEVRALLPDISQAVANQISELQSQSEDSESTENTTDQIMIDPDTISDNLVPDKTSSDIVTEIDAIKAENPVQSASMQEIMTMGFYILDVDCHHEDKYGPEDGIDDNISDSGAVVMHDDGTPGKVQLPEHCEASYSYITIVGEDNTLQEDRYFYEPDNSEWVKVEFNDEFDEEPHRLVLKEGQWIPNVKDGPEGSVEFTSDGGAILNSEQDKFRVYVTSRELDNTSVLHHLKGRGANGDITDLVSVDEVFHENSDTYKLHIKRDTKLTILFNWYAEDGEDFCEQFNGNCNVIGTRSTNGFQHFSNLESIQEASIYGVLINEMVFDHKAHRGIDVKLEADADGTDAIPKSGTVSWLVPRHPENPGPGPSEGSSEFQCKDAVEEQADMQSGNTGQHIEETRQTDAGSDELAKPICDYQQHEKQPDGTQNDDGSDGSDEATTTEEQGDMTEKFLVKSRWKTIVHEGISMIEIEMPIAIRHRSDLDEVATLLLIEQGDFVRRGARLSERSVDDETGYSEASFNTLQPIIEKYVRQ